MKTATSPLQLSVSPDVARAAAEWLTLQMGDEMDAAQWQAFEAWRSEHPEHEKAWLHIESMRRQLGALESKPAYRSLSRLGQRRRQVNQLLLLLGLGTTGTLLVRQSPAWQQQFADLRTEVGEQRVVTLADGSRLHLNTNTAVDLLFDQERRQIRLLKGELHIQTGSPQDQRPLMVETRYASARPLGTEFILRQGENDCRLAVLQGRVQLTQGKQQPMTVDQGHSAYFDQTGIHGVQVLRERFAWLQGQLFADNTRLGDFIEDLSRYHRGHIRCSHEVAELRLSGVFPLGNTHAILAALADALPVRVESHFGYWTRITPL